jgi:prevent-host-death family protein
MLVETNNLVALEDFRKDLDRYVDQANQGNGPVAILRDSRVVGVIVSPDDYDAMCGTAIRNLLKSRERGPSVSHEEACRQLGVVTKRKRKARA